MYIAIMSAFGQSLAHGAPDAASIQTADWMGRLKLKPGSRDAAESRMPPRH
jgi:hypothetical protein